MIATNDDVDAIAVFFLRVDLTDNSHVGEVKQVLDRDVMMVYRVEGVSTFPWT